jgi:hypothetical protein
MRTALTLAAVVALSATSAFAAPCRDAKTKRFIKCPVAATAKPATRCKDAKGKFAKCGTPGTHPA